MIRKFNQRDPISWDHHRSGWKMCVKAIHDNLHTPSGILLISHFESAVQNDEVIKEPWVGFIHNTIKGWNNGLPLDDILLSRTWQESVVFCKGIYVLSNYIRDYLSKRVYVPVETIYHPIEFVDLSSEFTMDKFNNNPFKKIVMVGHWLRKFESIIDLKSNYQKAVLAGCDINYDRFKDSSDIELIKRLNDVEYDELLEKNLVFIDLEDSSANNIVLECIVRNNPIIIVRQAATEEYLGREYPLFYDFLDEASIRGNSLYHLTQACKYLKSLPKQRFHIDCFIKSIVESNIYKNLPISRLLL